MILKKGKISEKQLPTGTSARIKIQKHNETKEDLTMFEDKKNKNVSQELEDAALDKVAGGVHDPKAVEELKDSVSKKTQMPHYPPSV